MEQTIINAAVEICGRNDRLKKDIVGIYNSAPDTFKKHKVKLGQSCVIVKDMETFFKVASVLKEGKKKDGLARKPLMDLFEDMDNFLVENTKCVDSPRTVTDVLYTHYRATRQYKLALNGELPDRGNRNFLKPMHEKPFFGEVCESVKFFLVDKRAFQSHAFQMTMDNTFKLPNPEEIEKGLVDFPLHDVTVGGQSVLAKEPENIPTRVDTFSDHGEFIHNLLGREVAQVVIEWNLQGLNGYQTLYDNSLTTKESVQLVEMAYWHLDSLSLDYYRTVDMTYLLTTVVFLYREWVFQKEYKKLFKTVQKGISPKEQKGKTVDTVTERLDTLTEENALLKRKLMAAEKNITLLRGSLKDANKQIYELNSQIPEPIEEEKVIIPEPVLEELPKGETDEERLIRFKEYIKTHKVLVWGCRDNHIRKLEQDFPELTLMGNKVITAGQLENYDFVVMRLDNTSHSTYYKVRATIDNSELPKCVMKKGENSTVNLVNKVLTVVDGGES